MSPVSCRRRLRFSPLFTKVDTASWPHVWALASAHILLSVTARPLLDDPGLFYRMKSKNEMTEVCIKLLQEAGKLSCCCDGSFKKKSWLCKLAISKIFDGKANKNVVSIIIKSSNDNYLDCFPTSAQQSPIGLMQNPFLHPCLSGILIHSCCSQEQTKNPKAIAGHFLTKLRSGVPFPPLDSKFYLALHIPLAPWTKFQEYMRKMLLPSYYMCFWIHNGMKEKWILWL